MTSRRKVHRARRHTLALLADAESALGKREHALALKLVLRALESGFMNPRVHAEAAMLLAELGRRDAAEAAAWRAHALAPQAPFVADTLARLGLEPLRAPPPAAVPGAPPAPRTGRSAAFQADAALAELRRCGVAALPEWLDAAEVEALAALPAEATAFTAARGLATTAGTLHWASFRDGAFTWFDAALAEAYACAAELANALAAELGETRCFPPAAGRPLPHVDRAVRLQLAGGATLARRPDPGSRDAFPLRACFGLGPAPTTLALIDLRPGRRREHRVEVAAGAAAFFCARERPVEVGGVLGLQPVAWEVRGPTDGACVLTSWEDVLAVGG